MNVITLEGIATGGKSTLANLLQKRYKTQVFTEKQTHEPIMHDVLHANKPFFETLLSSINDNCELVIFDRLYLTQAFRAQIDISAYADIENKLLMYPTTTVFLKVDENVIADRVISAAEHRHSSWGDYIATKGKNLKEIASYYQKQQRSLLKLLKRSTIPYQIYNTNKRDYERITEEITKLI